MTKRWPAYLILLVAAAIVAYIALAARNPVLYWWDSYTHLAHSDQLLLGRWLPGLRVVVYALGRLDAPLWGTRLVMIVIAAAAVVAIYACLAQWADPAVGLVAAALLAGNRVYVALSGVVYQEPLLLALLFGGLAFWQRPPTRANRVAAIALVMLACLTRYEAWLFVPILIGDAIWQSKRRGILKSQWQEITLTAAALVAVPAAWLLAGGFAVYEESLSRAGVVQSLADYAQWLRFAAGGIFLLLSLSGLLFAWRTMRERDFTRWATAFVALDITLAVLAGGLFTEDNLRRPFMAIAFLAPFAALAIVAAGRWLARWFSPQRGWVGAAVAAVVVAFLAVRGAWFGASTVRAAANDDTFLAGKALGEAVEAEEAAGRPCAAVWVVDDNPGFPFVVAVYSGRQAGDVGYVEDGRDLADERRPLCIAARDAAGLPASPPADAGPAPQARRLDGGILWVVDE